MNVTALYTNDGSVVIHPTFRPRFVNDLKNHVPPGCRKWRRHNASWWIDASYADIAVGLFKRHFPGGVVFVSRSIGGAA